VGEIFEALKIWTITINYCKISPSQLTRHYYQKHLPLYEVVRAAIITQRNGILCGHMLNVLQRKLPETYQNAFGDVFHVY